jgi:uncharacterized integral membrane protein (TIGR00698 family)
VVPGVAAAGLIAAVATVVRPALPAGISEIAIAILLGLVLANAVPLDRWILPGARFAVNRVLRLGVALLGARLAIDDVVRHGLDSLAFVALTTMLVLGAGAWLARRGESTLRLLIAAGTAICGNSAIVAIAPILDARERDVSFAVAVITGFGVLAVFVYPVIGQALGLPADAFGLWAGAAINDTSQVVAAGYAYGGAAGDAAVVTKLTRNLLLIPVLVALGVIVARRRHAGTSAQARPFDALLKGLPLFVIGFVLLATARSMGLMDAPIAGRPVYEAMSTAASAAVLVALAGVGLQTDVRALTAVGARPLLFGLGLALALGSGSLLAIVVLGLGGA